MVKEYSQAPSATDTPTETSSEGMVLLRHDEAIRQKEDFQPEAHWSNQITQPLHARWPVQPAPFGQRSNGMGEQLLRPVLTGAGWGGLLAILALSLLLLVAVNNGFLFGSTSASPESVPRPASVQPATPQPTHGHTKPRPGKSHPPKRHAAPKGPIAAPTGAPTVTTPAALSPTAPTAPPTPEPTIAPTAVPTAAPASQPTAAPAPQPTAIPASEPTPQPTTP